MNWISVKERLPEESGRYLVCIKMKVLYFPEIMVYSAERKAFMSHDLTQPYEGITHWMELPEAPEEEPEPDISEQMEMAQYVYNSECIYLNEPPEEVKT